MMNNEEWKIEVLPYGNDLNINAEVIFFGKIFIISKKF